jgi:paraquat-inducible protein B
VNDSETHTHNPEEQPRAVIKKSRWRFPVVWIVPLVAAIVAGYLVYSRVHEFGPTITIRFKNAGGMRAGQTPVNYRGVQIGEVTAVELSEDKKHVLVSARLRRTAASVAREGTAFWIVRPEVGLANITGLGTVLTGPLIEALPGGGKERFEFTGLESAPIAMELAGLKIVLTAPRPEGLKSGSPVFYRGIEVGAVQDTRLAPDAASIHIHVFIRQRYAKLVRKGSMFWNVSGMEIKAGLFKGVEVNLESMRSLLAGGIAFATPDDPGEAAKDGTMFPLHDKPKKEWLAWAPKIPVSP